MGSLGRSDWQLAARAAKRAYGDGHGRRSYSRERPRGEHITFHVERFQEWYAGEVKLLADEFLRAVEEVAGKAVARQVRERLEAEDDEDDVDL